MSAKGRKRPDASIRARLLVHARAHGDEFQRVLTRYAIERLLFRLARSGAADTYVLKGAMLFATWPEHTSRPTGDLDLLGYGNSGADDIARLFQDICQIECPEDGIVFDVATLAVAAVREVDQYQGARLTMRAGLAGAVIPVQVDIGFGDLVYPGPVRADFPGLLPELPVANMLMYPPETVIAEKLEAMIRFGEANGRIKDFYDIWVSARTFPFDLAELVEAVGGTLRRRRTSLPVEMPTGLAEAFVAVVEERGLWAGFVRRTGLPLGSLTFGELHADLRRFLGPVVAALSRPEAAAGDWDPNEWVWR